MPQNLLTDASVRSAKPKEKPYKITDGGGLFLLVNPHGTKLWRWKFRLGGKEGLFAVGAYPSMSLADARKGRDAARELVGQGINPAHGRQEEKRKNIAAAESRRREEEGAFGKVAVEWLAHGKAIWKDGTHRQKKSRVDRFLMPTLASKPISRIGAAEIRTVLESSQSAGAWGGHQREVRRVRRLRPCRTPRLGGHEPCPWAARLDSHSEVREQSRSQPGADSRVLRQAPRLPGLSRDGQLPSTDSLDGLPSRRSCGR